MNVGSSDAEVPNVASREHTRIRSTFLFTNYNLSRFTVFVKSHTSNNFFLRYMAKLFSCVPKRDIIVMS